jgi:hypothetical protein
MMKTALMVGVVFGISTAEPTLLATTPQPQMTSITTVGACSGEVAALTTALLSDLPSYTNRVRQRIRSRLSPKAADPGASYMLVAGRSEFEPLPLGPSATGPVQVPDLQQLFFTTLDRSYGLSKPSKIFLSKAYHWVFLTQTAQGWQVVMMLTRQGHSTPGHPPLPAIDTSQGAIAQAIRLWLRDCQIK